MSAEPSPASWQVELGKDAAREVRAAPPVVRQRLANLLDELAAHGVPASAEDAGGGAYRLRSGDIEAVVVVDSDARTVLVVRLSARHAPAARDALRVARVPPATSTRVALFLEELAAEARSSLRSLRKSPGFALSALATLAIAIGGATTLYGLGNRVFEAPLPFEDDHELLRLRDRRVTAGGDLRIFNMSPLNFTTIREGSTTLDGVAAAGGMNHVLTGGEHAQRVNVIRVSEGWGALLGIRPRVGRFFTAEEERLGSDAQVAVISHALWESRYGLDPAVVGQRLVYDGGVLTMVGVLPPRFRYPYDADLWTPWRWDASDGTSHDLNIVARMSDGVTLDEVRNDLDRVAAGLQEARPDTNADLFLNAESLRADFIRDEDGVLIALMAAVAFLLLLAFVNVTNLFVTRFVARHREVGIRVALGAGRYRQIRGFTVETAMLFLGGGLGGLLLSIWLGGALDILVPNVMRTQLDMDGVQAGPRLVAFAIGLSLLAGLVFGIFASLRSTGTDLAGVLKEGGRGTTGGATGVQNVLVVTQLALSLALLVGAGVLFEHFQRLSRDDLGMVVDGLYTVRVSVEQERFAAPDARLDVVTRLRDAIEAVPGVESAAYTTVNPLCCGDWGAPLAVEDRPRVEGSTHLIHHRLIGPGYFATTRTPVVRGRDFDGRDRPGTEASVIVDEALARRFWPDEDPLGKRVRLDRPGTEWKTVVGVVGDVEEAGDYSETWYLPYTQTPTARSTENLHFMIRSDDEGVLDEARRAVRTVDPNLATYEPRSMASLRHENISQDRLGATIGILFAVFGLLLAALGVFGILSYTVATRTREIGTRIALGAHPSRVTGMILFRALRLAGVGAVSGLVIAWTLNRTLKRIVHGVEAAGPVMLTSLAAVLLAASGVAAVLPAYRASRTDPVEAFRE